MKRIITVFAAIVALLIGTAVLSGCSSSEYQDRKDKQNTVTLTNSLGITAQKDRLKREDDPSTIRYVYLLTPLDGKVIGYYTIKGGVYGADTQLAPEQEIICRFSTGDSCQPVDSAKDNGTYGGADAGVFFITTEDVLIETVLPYLQSDAPIQIYSDAPKLTQ